MARTLKEADLGTVAAGATLICNVSGKGFSDNAMLDCDMKLVASRESSLTYPIAQGFFLSFGAIYATKPEFRGDVDAEISARAGFIYKVLRDE